MDASACNASLGDARCPEPTKESCHTHWHHTVMPQNQIVGPLRDELHIGGQRSGCEEQITVRVCRWQQMSAVSMGITRERQLQEIHEAIEIGIGVVGGERGV